MEDNGKEGSVLEKVPSILSVLAFISGIQALHFFTFLLALSDIVRKSQSVSKTPDYTRQSSPSLRIIKIKKAKRRKPKRRTQKVTPSLKAIRF